MNSKTTSKSVKGELVKELLDKIDSYTRDVDSCDYGRPLDYDLHIENLIAMVVIALLFEA